MLMHAVEGSLNRRLYRRLVGAIRLVASSEIGGKFRWMLGAILLLLVGINALNVLNSYVGRDLITAIEHRSVSGFITQSVLWVAVFTALTVAAVIVRFVEERLALLWREWLTRNLVSGYLDKGAYLRLKEQGKLENPDQRITEDARSFTATTLSFVLMLLNALFGIVAFAGVLWSISPLLLAVAVGYAVFGSLLTVVLGRPLVRLNYDQYDREANFRAELVHLVENAESVALLRLEPRLRARLRRRLEALVSNMKRIVSVNRNLGFFTTGYNYGIQLLPPLFVGPLFMAGKVEFGVITQSAMAFSQLLGAFSLIINQFGSISSYAAVLLRVTSFSAAVEQNRNAADPPSSPRSALGPTQLRYQDLTLLDSHGAERVLSHLTLTIPAGTRLLVTGTDEARRALFRATALGRDAPEGSVVFPSAAQVLFLPERPYVPPASLRELIAHPRSDHEPPPSTERILEVLRDLGLETAARRVGGIDQERDFSHVLSLSEQQLLSVGRVLLERPAFVVLQNPGTTLAPEQLALALRRLSEASITYLTLGAQEGPPGAYDAILEIHADGSWGVRHSASG
jgi:vitamin B12/bleomycin/antimicrobial peptide transport system ATP-binding/permease protein